MAQLVKFDPRARYLTGPRPASARVLRWKRQMGMGQDGSVDPYADQEALYSSLYSTSALEAAPVESAGPAVSPIVGATSPVYATPSLVSPATSAAIATTPSLLTSIVNAFRGTPATGIPAGYTVGAGGTLVPISTPAATSSISGGLCF